MPSPFNDPATTVGIDYKALVGSLLLFTVDRVEHDIVTSFGPTDAVRSAVAVVDGPHKGDTYDDALIFPRVLQGALRPSTGGKMVLGRLGQGVPKAGQSPPWTLTPPTDADRDAAAKFLTGHQARTAAMEEPF